MRIDLSPSSMPELERGRGPSGASIARPETDSREAADADDVAQLATGSEAVQTLKEALGSTPDLRQQRVEALRQSISDGSFQVAREHIAEAMLAEARWRA